MRTGLARAIRALALMALVGVGWLAAVRPGVARELPYYVVRAATAEGMQPRILVVLDTSGSMSLDPDGGLCRWDECEAPQTAFTTDESWISAVRRVVHAASTVAGDRYQIGMMTFEQLGPPTAAVPVCNDYGEPTRFAWVTNFVGFNTIYRYTNGAIPYAGAWRLCTGAERRSYPYLRWDNLGVGSLIAANNETGAPPASPLIATDSASMGDFNNAKRKVQFFPEFLGVRVQLNATTDPGSAITYTTWGDYGDDNLTRDTEVYNHDFYYWPYVDGFPGYGGWSTSPNFDGIDIAGIVGEDPGIFGATLYANFYMDLSATTVPMADWGPASAAEAAQELRSKASPITEGGVDVVGGAPWADAIGVIPAIRVENNTALSHTSVASYLDFARNIDPTRTCVPTAAVLVTDDNPNAGQGGATLYERLAALRNTLGVKTFVVALDEDTPQLHAMACAGAGACAGGAGCGDPCGDTSANAWDTCANPAVHATECAYTIDNVTELAAALTAIASKVTGELVESGPAQVLNDHGVGANGEIGQGDTIQTILSGYTNLAGFQGHVTRSYCTDLDTLDLDGDSDTTELAPFCQVPVPEFDPIEVEETFGPCVQSRAWDAAECLRQTAWTDRRVYSYDSSYVPYLIADAGGAATATFVSELTTLGLIPGPGFQAQADAVVSFLLGENAPGGWKLAGLANSSPVLVRRIPQFLPERIPEVAIRDPHCAGRSYGQIDAGALPVSLYRFAEAAWDDALKILVPSSHYEYQEAVIVGSDMGLLHAFQYNSGNELWALLPRPLLSVAVDQAANGAVNMGQPSSLEQHIFGIASTPNRAWIVDSSNADPALWDWKHLAVFGFGDGGTDYVALDVSHMSPSSGQGPVEVLWDTEAPALKVAYDQFNAFTWARPAITYHLPPGDNVSDVPDARLVFGGGYKHTGADPVAGRTLIFADALDGSIIESVEMPDPAISTDVFGTDDEWAPIGAPAVGSHCISRYWAEAQEVYVADTSGRLWRWDQGRTSAHESDSGAVWGALATPVFEFPACTGPGATCTVAAGNENEVFNFPPAVSSNDRIDDFTAVANGDPVVETDDYLVALISGSASDAALDPDGTPGTFQSSLYILVDDHSVPPKTGGFNIPAGAPKSAAGPITAGTALTADANYVRLALTDIERTRTFTPYPGAMQENDTGQFSPRTRPIRAPQITVTGVVDRDVGLPDVVLEGTEVFFVTFTVHDPGTGVCDPRFFEGPTNTWHPDRGATFELSFRLTADVASGFNYITGTGSATVDFGMMFEKGMSFEGAQQVSDDSCPDGNCGPTTSAKGSKNVPCDYNIPTTEIATTRVAVPLRSAPVTAFSPIE